ncbi:XRE family transcriptional regulator [Terrimonas sp.]|uniref:helix-turn-helix domain-containing protein n=1 Tax=Terrimonas sp. TaxID=1914338 RepID=UPI000D508087|nr:helix-turn-helix transcriptional regulator [Terrimonas sp.]PVD54103.1 XRE family transcriptional regulator [Terrimonas sp.]
MEKVPDSDFLVQFGKQVEKFRKKKKLSYRKLAQNCNIDYSDISKIEKGKANITMLTLLELAKGLEIHPKKLLDFEFDFED